VALVWSDTQGCEGDVILSAPELWSAGVPLFAELWPAALDRHGGSEVLAAAVDHGFAAFVDARDLVRDGDRALPRPVDQLASVSGELRGEAQTDILLLPARGPRG
jgi:hypothetical protein